MRVRFFAFIRNETGCAEAEIPYEETLGALARSLCAKYGEGLRQKIYSIDKSANAANGPEEFSKEIIFLINGRHMNHLGGAAAPLKPDDRVDVFPVVAGG